MPTMKYKSNQNEDTAYCDGHKVQLIAVPAGTLQKPIHATSDAGYVVDGNGKKHRVLMAVFLSGTPDYKPNETSDTAYLTVNGQKVKVRLASKENGTLTLSDSANVNKGYAVGTDGEKHRVLLVNTPSGTLELPNSETDDSAYVIDNGKKTKVRMFVLINGAGIEVVVGPAVSPLSLPDAIANSLHYVKAFGGTELSGTPTPSTPATITCNNGILKVKDSELPVGYKRLTGITYDSDTYYETNEKLYGSDTLTIRLSGTTSNGRNVVGAYSGTGDNSRNFSLFIYGANSTSNSYLRHGTQLGRPRYGTGTRTLVISPTGTDGFLTDVTYDAEDFETTDTFWIGALPNSQSTKYDGNIIGNITVSNRLKYIPCERVSDGKIGYYETFTGTFLENQGNGTPVSMGYDISYMTEIYADGTVETIEDSVGNSATCEPLLAYGDYVDVQSILDGVVTRTLGAMALTGDEDWSNHATYSEIKTIYLTGAYSGSAQAVLSTHYQGVSASNANMPVDSIKLSRRTTTDEYGTLYIKTDNLSLSNFKSFLAAQAAAGTPVIIVYPLATPITESVTGQTLQVTQGDNTLEITQASLSNLELEAKYMKEE